MKHTHGILAVAACLVVAFASNAGCGGGGGTGTGGSSTHATGTATSTSSATGTGGGPTHPLPPALGMQIDRFGRPAINTALNHAFDTDMAAKGAAKDTWNQDADPSKWPLAYAADVGTSLAILDGLDTKCGNQVFADMTKTDPTRYAKLAGVLADDRLWIKTDAAACTTYLAVESAAASTDCGGRKLDYDVIDASYSLLASGAPSGVSDGVGPDADTMGTMFPYLAVPH